MGTLILAGSPRLQGDTFSLVEKLTQGLSDEFKIVDAYRCNVSPCVDCRYCWNNSGCSINDEMQEIYDYIEHCDNIVIASPIYFSELTGKLLDVGSRLQTFFAARMFRKEEPIVKAKKGAVILVGGGDGNMNKAYDTACTLLHHMNCYRIYEPVTCHNTNHVPAKNDTNILEGIENIIKFFNSEN